MALQQIKITGSPGDLAVSVGGQDVSPEHVSVSLDRSGIPQVTLEVQAGVDLELDGVVQVAIPPAAGELFAAMAAWLRSIDPATVQSVVESRMQTIRDNPIAKTIEVLAETAEEQAD